MTITITIHDSAASVVMQNIARAKGWSQLSDDEVRAKLAEDTAISMRALARTGQLLLQRQKEQDAISDELTKIIVA